MKRSNIRLAVGGILLACAMLVSCTAVDPVPQTDLPSGEAVASSESLNPSSNEAVVSSEADSQEAVVSQSAVTSSGESNSEAAASQSTTASSEETISVTASIPSKESTSSKETEGSGNVSSQPSLEEMFPDMDSETASIAEGFLNSGLGSSSNPLELPEVEYVPPSGS